MIDITPKFLTNTDAMLMGLSPDEAKYFCYAVGILGGTLFYGIARKPEVMGELMKGVGEIVKGIGEVIPL